MPVPCSLPIFKNTAALLARLLAILCVGFIWSAVASAGFIGEVAPWGRTTYTDRWQTNQPTHLPAYLRVCDVQSLANPQLVIVDGRATNRKVLAIISLATANSGYTRLIASPSQETLPIELDPLGNTVFLADSLDRLLLSGNLLQKRHLLLFDGPTNFKVNSLYNANSAGSAKLLDGVTLGTGATALAGEFTTAMQSGMILSRIDSDNTPSAAASAMSRASIMTLNEVVLQETILTSPYIIGTPNATGLLAETDPNYLLPYWWEPPSWNALATPVVIPEPSGAMMCVGVGVWLMAKRKKRA